MTARHVAIDARMIDASGIGTYLRGLLEGIRLREPSGFRWSLLGDPARLPKGPWSVHSAVSSIYSLREQLEIPRQFRRSGAELLHAPHYNMPVSMASRTVVTVHDLIHLKFPQYWPSAMARLYAHFFFHNVVPKARAILTVSESTKRDLVEMLSIPRDRITVAYPAVDSLLFQKKDPLALEELKRQGLPQEYLLYIGNLKEFKNVPRLIEAYSRLRQRRKDSPPLVLVGRNSIPDFDKLMAKIPGVQWMGEVTRERLPALYQNALAFLFPSLYEGFGLPPLEAMASGTPVLCSHRASLPEVVGEAALMVDPENTDEISASMERLIDDSALRKELSLKGLRQASLFSWGKMTDQTVRVYDQCLA